MTDVVLVSMPFGPEMSPSLGLSLLKASLARRGVPSRVLYFTLRFAEALGVGFYTQLSTDGTRSIRELAGEWLFRDALFGRTPRGERRYVDEVLVGRSVWPVRSLARPVPASFVERLLRARARVEPFLDACLEAVLAERPRVVGFTSVFQQHVASLALARRVKAAAPGTTVVLGGANCEGVMGAETVRQFPFVDAAVSGEGDLVFPELVERALAGRPLDGLPGVRTRATVAAAFAERRFPNAPSVAAMDDLPEPDFSDYFEQFAASRLSRTWQPGVFFETSRGCWWGEKSTCTFCGLNGATMRFRSKSPARAVDELARLAARHPGCDVQVVDNILDTSYLDSVVPELARRRLGLTLFWETKASLAKEQVRRLASAGVTRIQPGIESFSDPILKLMRKGVTALQNVQLLKWCRELGVKPYWNVLWGFPGEPPDEYARMAALVPLLAHLPPPQGVSGLRLDRFSPGFEEPARFGFAEVAPLPSYRHVYPFAPEVLANLAYFFSFRPADGRDPGDYVGPLLAAVRRWTREADESALFFVDVGGKLVVWDLRPRARRALTVLEGLPRLLYLACDAATDVRALAAASRDAGGTDVGVDEALRALEPLVSGGLVLRAGSRFLALATRLGDGAIPDGAARRFDSVARTLGRKESHTLVVPLHNAHDGEMPRSADGGTRKKGAGRSRSAARPRLSEDRFSLNRRGELVIT